jgi:hypothetical protein
VSEDVLIDAILIRIDGGTQPRAEIDIGVVQDYAQQMVEGAMFPPVVVFHDGAEYWLASGFHRYHARVDVLGETEIEAEVRQGTRREAVLFSIGENVTHGLRRSNEDKRRAALTLLRDEEWSKWSDSEIARRCVVSHDLVSDLRRTSLSFSEGDRRTYTTKHGTEATMSVGNLGQSRSATTEYTVEDEMAYGRWQATCPTCGQKMPG